MQLNFFTLLKVTSPAAKKYFLYYSWYRTGHSFTRCLLRLLQSHGWYERKQLECHRLEQFVTCLVNERHVRQMLSFADNYTISHSSQAMLYQVGKKSIAYHVTYSGHVFRRVHDNSYLEMLIRSIIRFQEKSTVEVVWIQQYGTPANFALWICDFLMNNCWISHSSQTWPAHCKQQPTQCPDLTVPDNSLWGIIKTYVP